MDIERLRYLASPDAERMSDYQRLNEFVKFGHEAADEIERLRGLLHDAPIVVIDERYAAFCEEGVLVAYAQAVREWHPKVKAALTRA